MQASSCPHSRHTRCESLGAAMIEHIDNLLNDWAEWRVQGSAPLSSGAAWARLITDSEVFNVSLHQSIPFNALVCERVDRCVAALDSKIREAVEERYLRTSTREQECLRCHCSERTFRYRLDAAHRTILRMLQQLAATGVEPGLSNVRETLRRKSS